MEILLSNCQKILYHLKEQTKWILFSDLNDVQLQQLNLPCGHKAKVFPGSVGSGGTSFMADGNIHLGATVCEVQLSCDMFYKMFYEWCHSWLDYIYYNLSYFQWFWFSAYMFFLPS